MKKGIHPKYEQKTFTCVCGATYELSSTASNMHIDICSKCHPFFTGKEVFVDTAGRIERFKQKYKITDMNPGSKKK